MNPDAAPDKAPTQRHPTTKPDQRTADERTAAKPDERTSDTHTATTPGPTPAKQRPDTEPDTTTAKQHPDTEPDTTTAKQHPDTEPDGGPATIDRSGGGTDRFSLRPATAADVDAVAALVHDAYSHYVERIGFPPGPMNDDYAEVVRDQDVLVALDPAGVIAGVLVLAETDEGFFVENVAVHPEHQGQGLGRVLLDRAETEATQRGMRSIRLYTHVLMTENIALYARRGYVEYERRVEGTLIRVFMRKDLD